MRWEGVLEIDESNPHAQSKVSESKLVRATYSRDLSIFKDGSFTISVQPVPMFDHSQSKKIKNKKKKWFVLSCSWNVLPGLSLACLSFMLTVTRKHLNLCVTFKESVSRNSYIYRILNNLLTGYALGSCWQWELSFHPFTVFLKTTLQFLPLPQRRYV